MILDHLRQWAERTLTHPDDIVVYGATVLHPDGRVDLIPEVTRRQLDSASHRHPNG